MFKVMSKQPYLATRSTIGASGKIDRKKFEHFCKIEEWSANTNTGQIHLGPVASRLHSIDVMGCGLSNLISSYEAKDQASILDIFETITLNSSSFTYTTTIEDEDGVLQPVFCIGESQLDEDCEGSICGIFVFPYVIVDNLDFFTQ